MCHLFCIIGYFISKKCFAKNKLGKQNDFYTEKKYDVPVSVIGTSSNGRTYAGTVRSADCRYLAQSRVADR